LRFIRIIAPNEHVLSTVKSDSKGFAINLDVYEMAFRAPQLDEDRLSMVLRKTHKRNKLRKPSLRNVDFF
jgi:hypothetical protein